MLAMFHRDCAVYTKKEVEKAASKEGIVAGAIEGVLKELVGDSLVHEGKISGQLFYWSFPGERATQLRQELASARAESERRAQQITSLQQQERQLRKEHGQSEEQAAALKAQESLLNEVRQAEANAIAEAEQLKKQAAQNLHVRKKDIPVLKEAANRWTDNLFMMRQHCIDKCGMDPKAIDAMLGTDKIDYVDD